MSRSPTSKKQFEDYEIRSIRVMYEAGFYLTEIADQHNISDQIIQKMVTDFGWNNPCSDISMRRQRMIGERVARERREIELFRSKARKAGGNDGFIAALSKHHADLEERMRTRPIETEDY